MKPHSIRRLRHALGWTQARLALVIGVHRGTVSRWERGKQAPSRDRSNGLQLLAASMRRKPRQVVSHRTKEASALVRERREIEARLNGRQIVASVSGGKDSSAMSKSMLRMARKNMNVDELVLHTSIESCEAAQVDYAAFDLCFLDLNIPKTGFSAREAIRLLKQRGARRVIIATGSPLYAYEQTLREEGADGFAAEKVPTELKSFLVSS